MATPTALPAAFTVGQVLTSANMNLLRGGFRILQVVSGTTSTAVTSATTTLVDTGLTATITPSSTTSKIFVIVTQNGVLKNTGDTGNGVFLNLLRGATQIAFQQQIGSTNTNILSIIGSASFTVLDSPATISATTYKTQFCNNVNAANVITNYASATSTITLFEVSA